MPEAPDSSPSAAVCYSHDPFGPRTRMTDIWGSRMAHCNYGNTLTQTNTSTGTVTHFTWDYENRLTEVKVVSKSGTVLNDEKFTYDVFGNRIGVSLNGTQTLYTVYDGSNPYMDFNGSGSVTERYLYNPYAQNQFYGQVNGSGTTEWFVTDNLNSIRQVLSASGASLATMVYDPFGQLLTSLNSYAPRFLYTGGAYDAITGMYTDGAREENPVDGRWMSQDPMRFGGGDANLYRYLDNGPTNFEDPYGLVKTDSGSISVSNLMRRGVNFLGVNLLELGFFQTKNQYVIFAWEVKEIIKGGKTYCLVRARLFQFTGNEAGLHFLVSKKLADLTSVSAILDFINVLPEELKMIKGGAKLQFESEETIQFIGTLEGKPGDIKVADIKKALHFDSTKRGAESGIKILQDPKSSFELKKIARSWVYQFLYLELFIDGIRE